MIKNISELKAKSDIVDIIGRFLILKKAGANYQSPCPFHNERSASFIVSPQKQIFTCFGCGVSGDVIKFIQEFKRVSFSEALEELSTLSGVELEYEKSYHAQDKDKQTHSRQKYESLFTQARAYLLTQKQILQYLYNRGLKEEDLSTFSIGLMPPLEKVRAIFDTSEGLELGVLKKRQDGAIYTPFKNRIIFALHNAAHKIVGLSGRTHPYENFKSAPKYINSAESYLFKKSQNLYLFSQAKAAIKEQKRAIIVEGYMDAIALHKLGFKNAIATCGTAFNLAHCNQIYRLTPDCEMLLCFDSDEAGQKATLRAIELLFTQRLYQVKVMRLSGEYKDIGEVLEKGVSLEYTLKSALSFYIGYRFKHAQNAKAKDEIVKDLLELCKRESNYFARDELISEIARITHISKEFFTQTKTTPKPTHTKELRILELLHALYNNEDCAFIAKDCLDLEAIPREYRGDLQVFLESGELKESAYKIALNDRLSARHNVDSAYNEIMQLNMMQAHKRLDMAKIEKDLPLIISLSGYIEQCRQNIEKSAIDIF